MFSALKQNSPVYILDKGNKPSLTIGSVSELKNQFGTYQFGNTIDITVSCDDGTKEFKNLPAGMNKSYYDNKIVISSDKDVMLQEVESFIANSRQILDNIDYHKNVVETGDSMLARLNPQIAKDKANEEKINNLEKKVSNIGGQLNDIKDMLSQALNNKN